MNVMIVSSNSSVTNGASQALLSLAIGLTKNRNHIIVLLPEQGELSDKLSSIGIKSYVVNQHNGLWITPTNNHNSSSWPIIFKLKRFIALMLIAPKVMRIILKERIDIVHVNALTSGLATVAAYLLNRPVVWHVREFLEEGIGASFRDPIFSRKLISRSSAVIAISEVVRHEVENRFPRAKVHLVYDGVDAESNTRQELLINKCISVLSVGRFMPLKGQKVLLQALKILVDQGLNVHVSFLGEVEDQAYFKEARSFVKANALEAYCEFKGFQSQLKDEYSKADVVCITTVVEAFGLTTVEALRYGCLVIGRDTGATPEIIKDHVTGLIYNHHDEVRSLATKLRWVAEHRAEAKQIAFRGKERNNERFTLMENINRIQQIYHNL